jgi:hypothetical protein
MGGAPGDQDGPVTQAAPVDYFLAFFLAAFFAGAFFLAAFFAVAMVHLSV